MTSTFLRQAFLPLRLACLYCAGAAPVSVIVSSTSLCWRVVGLVVAKSSIQKSDQRMHGLSGQGPPRTPALLGSRCWPAQGERPPVDQHSYSDTAPRQDTKAPGLTTVYTLRLLLFLHIPWLLAPISQYGASRVFESAQEVQVRCPPQPPCAWYTDLLQARILG